MEEKSVKSDATNFLGNDFSSNVFVCRDGSENGIHDIVKLMQVHLGTAITSSFQATQEYIINAFCC